MKKFILGLSLLALLTLAAAPAALACEKGGCKGHGMVMCSCFDKKLGLSDDQQKKIDALRQKTEKKAAPAMKNIKAKKAEMQALWAAAKPSRKAILAKQAQIRKIKQKLGVIKVDAHLALLKILTAEQKQTLIKEKETCCKGGTHPEGCQCPGCKGHGHPAGCDCPGCKKKAAAEQPAEKKPGCKGCPGCPHH
ncbi:Spy/CpxP family protein refolding chaperone [Myxococcota bacterium]